MSLVRPWLCGLAAAATLSMLACSSVPPNQPGADLTDHRPPDSADQVACTMSFAMITVRVVDTTGALVEGATIAVTRARTGENVQLHDQGLPYAGTYVVLDDSWREKVDPAGERFDVTASKDGRQGSAQLTIGAPGAGHCHVQRLAGPEQIVVR